MGLFGKTSGTTRSGDINPVVFCASASNGQVVLNSAEYKMQTEFLMVLHRGYGAWPKSLSLSSEGHVTATPRRANKFYALSEDDAVQGLRTVLSKSIRELEARLVVQRANLESAKLT